MFYGLAMLLFAGALLLAATVVIDTVRMQSAAIARAMLAMRQPRDNARRAPWSGGGMLAYGPLAPVHTRGRMCLSPGSGPPSARRVEWLQPHPARPRAAA